MTDPPAEDSVKAMRSAGVSGVSGAIIVPCSDIIDALGIILGRFDALVVDGRCWFKKDGPGQAGGMGVTRTGRWDGRVRGRLTGGVDDGRHSAGGGWLLGKQRALSGERWSTPQAR
eukprot:CAMPEP_0175824456 /NCGR_PEP_ID=MMETSP0107_2-20121207/10736_1 /TAXON_ID=195067 ORGANISM="Goniomonas pacifica, Strain CCMP1869" /NCGR_SAMPLE_ID=MMETSP0107_2 /ASSEMBLY_ACC=CAM_ASM_000203 /LENGTH=115 /DNA_ID=CAMNT_0017137019 /DNA_START=140 /DNA_END=484 /DNA_ORIENTATION=+